MVSMSHLKQCEHWAKRFITNMRDMTQRFDMAYNNNGDRDIMGMRADLIFMFYERLTISLFQTSNPFLHH